MKNITFMGAGMLASVATMLECLGYETDDKKVAFGMEAPYLFVHRDGEYRAGVKLYQPEWLNIYLHPIGFSMETQTLQRAEVPAFLRSHKPVLVPIEVSKGWTHPVVFRHYENGRYSFINVRSADIPEPDAFFFTSDMLKRRLDDTVKVFLLTECEPTEVDVIPMLLESLRVLTAYEADLLESRKHVYTREEFDALYEPLFRAIVRDYVPLSGFLNDKDLNYEIKKLSHAHKHVFLPGDESVELRDCLSIKNIKNCLLWVRENIYDRLCDLDVPDELFDMAHKL